MKVNSDISFKGFYNNKVLKKGLEFAADNGALLQASITLGFSMFVRPISISLAPQTEKENKIMACAKSIASSSTQFLLTLGLSLPIVNATSQIGNNPQKYLKPETINNLQNNAKKLRGAKEFEFATQIFKIGLGGLIAIPKALLTAALMPFILKKIFHSETTSKNDKSLDQDKVSFKGKNPVQEKITGSIAKVLNTKRMQEFSKKHKDSNFVMHIVAATDLLTTATFIRQMYVSDKIKESRKKALIYNTGISTALSIITSYILDSLTKKPTEKFIEKYRAANKNSPKLEKQVQGIKIAKPIILVATVYYMLIPFISTILAEQADHNPKFDIPKHKKTAKFQA